VKPRNKPIRTKSSSPFAKNLKAVLAERGISQKSAFELAGVTPATLNDWLGGTQPSDPIAVQRLCRALKADFEWLLTGEKSRVEPRELTRAKLTRAVNEFKNKGLYKGEWGPLDLRHSFAVNFLAKCGDMRELQRILGHNNVFDTKRLYAEAAIEKVAKDVTSPFQ
jgi:transcriptional regulator with XRE-family HTH domain